MNETTTNCNDMTTNYNDMAIPDEMRLRRQLDVLRDVANDYHGRTIENIINNIEQRIAYYESH